ncbi:MAG: DUF4907 domain-containing protein [Bacteroidales bacterium]|nr:DUF4907 domain-containing protein [Bacteroidales bacterium]
MRGFVILVMMVAAAVLVGCNGAGSSQNAGDEPVSLKFDTVAANIIYSVETQKYDKDSIEGIDSGYGYLVSVNGKKFINQKMIPVIEGKHRFATAEDALNTGKVVITKMIQTADLPSLTKADLIKLGILSQDGTLKNTRK